MGNIFGNRQRTNTPSASSSATLRQREASREERKKSRSLRGSAREKSTRKQEEKDHSSRQEKTEKDGRASQTRLRGVSPMPPKDEATERKKSQDRFGAEDSRKKQKPAKAHETVENEKPVEQRQTPGASEAQHSQGSQRASASDKPQEAEPRQDKPETQEPSSVGVEIKEKEAAQKLLPVASSVEQVAAAEPGQPAKASKPIKEVWTHRTAQATIPEKPQEPQKEEPEPTREEEKETVKNEPQSADRVATTKTAAVERKELQKKFEVTNAGIWGTPKATVIEKKEPQNKPHVTNTKNLVAKVQTPEVTSKALSTDKLPSKPEHNAKPEARGVVQSESVVGSSFEKFGARVKTGHQPLRGLKQVREVGKFAPGEISKSSSDEEAAAKDEDIPDPSGDPDKLVNKGAKKDMRKQQEVDDDNLPSWKKLGRKKVKDRTSRISILASEAIYIDEDDAFVDGQKIEFEHFSK